MNIKTQQISGSFGAASTTLTFTAPTNFTAVADVNKAFVIVSNTLKKGNAAATAANQHLCRAFFTDASTITVTRNTSGLSSGVEIQIVEFTGSAGDPNEFIVRLHETVSFAAGDTTKTGSSFSPTTKEDCVPIICGISASDFTDAAKDSAICAYITGASNTVTFERTASTGAAVVAYAVVEFLGSNWTVQEKQYTFSGTGQSSTTITSCVPSETFIVASRQQANGSNRGAGLTWSVFLDNSTPTVPTTTLYFYQYTESDNAWTGADYRVYLISNPVLNVTHFSGTASTSTTDQTVDITSARIDNAKSLLLCYGANNLNGTPTGNSYSFNVKYNSDVQALLYRGSTDTSTILYHLQVIGFNNNSKQIPLTFKAQNSTNRKIALSLTGQSIAKKNVVKLSFKPQATFSRTINLTSQANENPLYLPYEPVISLNNETYHGFVATLSIQGSVDSLFQSTLATAYTKKKVIGLSWKGNEYGLLKFTFNCAGSGLPIKLSFAGIHTTSRKIHYSLTGQNSNKNKIALSLRTQDTTSNKIAYSFTGQKTTANHLIFSFCGQSKKSLTTSFSFRTEDDLSYKIPLSLSGQHTIRISQAFSFRTENDASNKIALSFWSVQYKSNKICLSYCSQTTISQKVNLSYRTQNVLSKTILLSYNGANSYAANLPLTFRAEQDSNYSIKLSFSASYLSNSNSTVFSFSAKGATQQNTKLSYTGQYSYKSNGNKLSFSGALSCKNKIAYSYSAQHALYLNNKLSYTAQSVKSYHLPISLSAALSSSYKIKYSYAAISSLSCKISLSYIGGFSKSTSINFSFVGQRNIAKSLKLSFVSSKSNSSNIGLSFSGNYVKSAVFSLSFNSYSAHNQAIPLSYSAYSVSANKLKVSYAGQRNSANNIWLSFNSYLSGHASHLYLSFNTNGSTKNKTIRLTFKVGPSRGAIIEYSKKPIIKPHYKPYNTTCE